MNELFDSRYAIAAIAECGHANDCSDEQIAEAIRDYLRGRFPELNPTIH